MLVNPNGGEGGNGPLRNSTAISTSTSIANSNIAYYAAYKHSWSYENPTPPTFPQHQHHHQNGTINNDFYPRASSNDKFCCIPPTKFSNNSPSSRKPLNCNNGQESNNLVPNYGAYHETPLQNQEQDEDGGFVPRSGDRRLEVMVNIRGTSSVVQNESAEQSQRNRTGSSWRGRTTTSSDSESQTTWCKPEAILVILCIAVVLVSTAFVYIWYVEFDYGHAYIEEPCEKTFCAWGAQCVASPDGTALCQCPTHCRPHIQQICASDGKTYENRCQLRVASCRARLNLKVLHEGKCGRNDPCKEKQCGWGTRCVASLDGRASCQCVDECPSYGDHLDSRPVCGSNNLDYKDKCELMRAVCTTAENITVKHFGKCDPCQEHNCTHGASCINQSGQPYCQCPSCPDDYDPVCGSDGSTYNNECNLQHHSCTIQENITVISKGPCNGCENKQCDFYATCVQDTGRRDGSKCVCPQSCDDPQLYPKEICGLNGKTYKNECELRIESCEQQKEILINFQGNCDLCQRVECKYGGRCHAGECICPKDCFTAGNEPVCGSNLITYTNECELLKTACVHFDSKTGFGIGNLTVLFYGDCNEKLSVPVTSPSNFISPTFLISNLPNSESTLSTNSETEVACKDIQCDFEATCELGVDNFPRCVCQFNCNHNDSLSVDEQEPICASNMRIYPSLCAMKLEACQNQQELRLRPLDLCQGMEVKPCNGDQPLINPVTSKEFDCGNGPNRHDCPSGSYCHQTTRFAKCCSKDTNKISEVIKENVEKGCENTVFGCCQDGKTTAQGPSYAGCPPFCGCNKLGSYSENCDVETLQCKCRPGVGGEKCDRCEPGYWGLPKISSGHHGCIPCGCSIFGSVRDDCEQMTGRCVCKSGVQGQKCNICANPDKILTPNGCVTAMENLPAKSCKEFICYLGGKCIEKDGVPICDCPVDVNCEEEINPQIVCGSDGKSYSSSCMLKHESCKLQKDIVIQSFGSCNGDNPGTEGPLRQYTPVQFTQSDDANYPLSKSTRHLMVPDPRYYFESKPKEFPNGLYPNNNNLNNYFKGFPFGLGSNSDNGPTPATVQIIQALLGDICNDNSECPIKFSECIFGACQCETGYAHSPNWQACLPLNSLIESLFCDSFVCLHGGTCNDITRECNCVSGYTGSQCEIESEIEFNIPSFDTQSYIRLKPLKAYHKLSIEIEFKTYSENGIILYNQQKANGLGDFVSLAIVNGYIEFRYDLGNGPVVITSLDKIKINTYHRVLIKRYHRDGMLQFDDGEVITGQSSGSLRALDLFEDTFIGFIPTNYSRIFENIGIKIGFHGCIKQLKIGRKLLDLHPKKDDWIMEAFNIQECSTKVPCSLNCQNNGHCQILTTNMTAYCNCQEGFVGKLCEVQTVFTNFTIPEFNGISYITLPTLQVSKSFTIEIIFLTKVRNGLIFYNGQLKTGIGDFISLTLVKGHLQFRFNLGSGICNITSKDQIELEKWHQVKIHRDGREGILQLDNGEVIREYSGGSLTELNLELRLYLGSLKSWEEIHRLAGASVGFKGAIAKFTVDGIPVNITRLPSCHEFNFGTSCEFLIREYNGLPCTLKNGKNPCFNHGICIPILNDYMCQCQEFYEGKNCEIYKNNFAIKFDAKSFLLVQNQSVELFRKEDNEEDTENNLYYDENKEETLDKRIELEVEMKTQIENGLVLWYGKNNAYLSIIIVNGYPEFILNSGTISKTTSNLKTKVNDGNWHNIKVNHYQNKGYLIIDNDTEGIPETLGKPEEITFIGEIPSLTNKYYLGFTGCLKTLIINNQKINLHSLSDTTQFCHNNTESH